MIEFLQSSLELTSNNADALYKALLRVISVSLYDEDGLATIEEEMASVSVDERLQGLVLSVVESSLPLWQEAARQTVPSLPSLETFDWRVDLKTSSSEIEQMSVPTLLLNLQVRNPPEEETALPSENNLTLELSSEALEAMLEGLGRIKDQLSSVAK